MSSRRRKEKEDYAPDYIPDESSEPSEPEPSKSSEPEPSGVITAEERLQADPDAYTLEPEPSAVLGEPVVVEPIYDPARVEREEAFRKAKAESDRIKAEQIAKGQDTVTHMGIQMTREQFEADFPGEPSGPVSAEDKAKAKRVDKAITDALVKSELSLMKFEYEMSIAGRKLGAEAKEAWKEGDILEATLKGTAAFSARAGSGIFQGASFLFRPLAIKSTAEELVKGAKRAIEHPEDIPSGVQKWAEYVAHDPGSIAEFSGGVAGGYLTGRVIGEAYRSWKVHRLSKFYAEFPEEAFYWEDGIPDPRIPQPTDVQRMAVKSVEKVRIVDDLGAGFLDEHLMTKGKWPKSGTKGFGYRRTGAGLIQEFVPEGVGRLETVYRFGLEHGQTHLPGVTGMPPYFEAALGLSPFLDILPSAGASSGLLSVIPSLDKPIADSKPDILPDVTPTIEDTGIDEKPRIIEMVDEIYKPKPKPKPPITIPRPEPKITPKPEPPFTTPIIDPILDEDEDVTTITIPDITTITTPKPIQDLIQEPIQDTILDIPPPIIPRYMLGTPKPKPILLKPPKKKRKPRMKKTLTPLGWELRKYKMPTLKESNGKKLPSLKIKFPENKKKKKRLPKL